MQAGDWKPKRLTDFNHALTSRPLGKAEAVHWDGPDGFKQNGVLVYPPDFQAGRRYPLVLNIHGGPWGRRPMRSTRSTRSWRPRGGWFSHRTTVEATARGRRFRVR